MSLKTQRLARVLEQGEIQSTGSLVHLFCVLAARTCKSDGSHPLDPLPLNLRRTVFPFPSTTLPREARNWKRNKRAVLMQVFVDRKQRSRKKKQN